eukprot:5110263-Pyramimonas_sp.AAC.1
MPIRRTAPMALQFTWRRYEGCIWEDTTTDGNAWPKSFLDAEINRAVKPQTSRRASTALLLQCIH